MTALSLWRTPSASTAPLAPGFSSLYGFLTGAVDLRFWFLFCRRRTPQLYDFPSCPQVSTISSTASASGSVMVSPHRAFIYVQSVAYWHQYPSSLGLHSSGPRAPFDGLARDATAIRWSGSSRWLAYTSFLLEFQAHAPDRWALWSGTMWSTSTWPAFPRW